ncbi:MAG: carbamoyltransferase HypF [Spirochaetes bacterium]|nr:carbamoyltransferase HypF [Spirochaetota bacterium]
MKKHCLATIEGIVQGVGFRPFVYRLAKEMNLTGYVSNTDEGVVIELEGLEKSMKTFLKRLKKEEPDIAFIEKIKCQYYNQLTGFRDFRIRKSQTSGVPHTLVSPEIALCRECQEEMVDKNNRRYHYFAINCIECGPRFTLLKDLPYDRINTSMNIFNMCPDCQKEYHDPDNRRYHAQPNCCPKCGPELRLYDNRQRELTVKSTEDLFQKLSGFIQKAGIIAVKGWGGYHLVCDAENIKAVERLRKRKKRPAKPLAVLSKNISDIKKYCYLSRDEENLLTDNKKAILLLRKKDNSDIIARNVAPGLRYLGVMLPYTATQFLLLQYVQKNLIFTSGNISEEPVIYEDDKAFERLGTIADYFLVFNRRIVMNNDDSVLFEFRKQPYVIRRSRGFVPRPIQSFLINKKILGLGAQQKNTFSLYFENKIIMSQHIGDMENYETFDHYKKAIKHFSRLFSFEPDIVVHDLHPDYYNTKYVGEIVPQNTERIGIQHHVAHMYSSLLDNGITGIEKQYIGVAFDGTGYGEDHNLWGGEFFILGAGGHKRAGHFQYVKMPGGEMAIHEPWRMALSYLYELFGGKGDRLLKQKWFSVKKTENIVKLLKNNINCPLTSSAGRFFDGVSALLGVCKNANYEGEPAVLLENLISYKKRTRAAYPFEVVKKEGKYLIDQKKIMDAILSDMKKSTDIEIISVKFHNTVASVILSVCQRLREETGIQGVVLGGGVFQNRYLLAMVVEGLEKALFKVFYHRLIPTNDAGISAGQVLTGALLVKG